MGRTCKYYHIVLTSNLGHSYYWDKSIPTFRVCFFLRRNCYKQTVLTMIRGHILQCLNWVCTVCVCPQKEFLV